MFPLLEAASPSEASTTLPPSHYSLVAVFHNKTPLGLSEIAASLSLSFDFYPSQPMAQSLDISQIRNLRSFVHERLGDMSTGYHGRWHRAREANRRQGLPRTCKIVNRQLISQDSPHSSRSLPILQHVSEVETDILQSSVLKLPHTAWRN